MSPNCRVSGLKCSIIIGLVRDGRGHSMMAFRTRRASGPMFNGLFTTTVFVRLLLGMLLLCVGLSAQVVLSTVRGTVTDQTGAVVADAQVTLVHEEMSAKRTTPTTENGDFEIVGLGPGTYRLTVMIGGFKTFVAEKILLQSGEVRRINVKLELGALSSEIIVAAGAALIATDTPKLESSLYVRRYPDAPLINLNSVLTPFGLFTTTPLIQQFGAPWSLQLAGQNTSQVQLGQDGHTNDGLANQVNDAFDSQEVIVVTGNPTADIARVGYLNQVTKSGSNQLHGQFLYEHLNPTFSARPFFAASKTRTLQHTFSNGVTGPILKDKTFFYASFNIAKVPSSTYFLQSVPTTKMRAGDFSQLLGLPKPITIKDPLTGVPFAGNIIPTSRLNPLSLNVNDAYLPAPNLGGPDSLANNFGFTFNHSTDAHVRMDNAVRIDHYFSSANRVMFRLLRDATYYINDFVGDWPAFVGTRERKNYHIVGEDTHVFSPRLVNTARMGWYRERTLDGGDVFGFRPLLGDAAVKYLRLQGVNPQGLSAAGFPVMNISGMNRLGPSYQGGLNYLDHNWDYADTVTWSKGKHVIKFGAEYKPQFRPNAYVKTGTYGTFTFDGSFTGYGYGDFILGLPYNSSRLNPLIPRTMQDSEFGVFITDDFKATSHLTLSLGVRWDRFGSPNFKDGLMWNWDLASGNIVVPEAARKAISPVYPPTINIVNGQVTQNPSNKNLVPRLGGAYRFTDRFVVRGAYGIYTETLGRYSRLTTGGPFEITETYLNQIVSGQPLFAFPNPFPSSTAPVASQSFMGYPLATSNGRIHQFNVTLERQVKDIGLRLTYLGSRNRGMNYSLPINKPQPSLTPFTQAMRPWPAFVGGTYYRSNGETNYDNLTLEAQRKMGQLTFDVHYTFASNMSNMLNLENPYAPLLWNRDPNTARHRAVANVVWQIPVGRGQKFLSNTPAVVDRLLGGWQLYYIAYFESGRFFTPSFSGSDPSHTNTSGGLPDRICDGNLPSGQRSVTHWFDASCFVVPPPGRFGNSGVNILQGPGNDLQNLSIAKTFRLTERLNFTFTASAQDFLNHPNFGLPAANISSPGTAGTISSLTWSGGYRVIEVRGRLAF